jgi:Na+/H+-dicarboxylate symporter
MTTGQWQGFIILMIPIVVIALIMERISEMTREEWNRLGALTVAIVAVLAILLGCGLLERRRQAKKPEDER